MSHNRTPFLWSWIFRSRLIGRLDQLTSIFRLYDKDKMQCWWRDIFCCQWRMCWDREITRWGGFLGRSILAFQGRIRDRSSSSQELSLDIFCSILSLTEGCGRGRESGPAMSYSGRNSESGILKWPGLPVVSFLLDSFLKMGLYVIKGWHSKTYKFCWFIE